MIRTVLGDITPERLGVTYLHEHLIIDSEIVAKDYPHIHLPSTLDAINELEQCKRSGVSSMVDCMPTGSGRDIRKLAAISQESGINIIASTGLHHVRYYKSEDPIDSMNESSLAELFISEIKKGCEGTSHKAGVIKVVTSGFNPTAREIRLMEAAAIAHQATGAPILTHCEHGTGAIEQIKILSNLNIDLSRVVLSHTDKDPDFGYHKEILSSGINVEYDQSLRQIDMENPSSALLTAEMIEQGYGDQIMLGTDGARRTLWTSLGGKPGLAALHNDWGRKLIEAGVEEVALQLLFVSNPAKFLSFRTNEAK